MHDANGNALHLGDTVLIPAKIVSLSPSEEYCNVGVETQYGRRPDGLKETIYSINTGVLVLHQKAEQTSAGEPSSDGADDATAPTGPADSATAEADEEVVPN